MSVAAVLLVLLGPPCAVVGTPTADDDPPVESVTIDDGRGRDTIRGRIRRVTHPDHVTIDRENSRGRVTKRGFEISRTKRGAPVAIEIANLRRTRLAAWFDARRQQRTIDDSWALVGVADDLGLPRLARLQALSILLENPQHADAHQRLGHDRHRGAYHFRVGKNERLTLDELERATTERWNDRFFAESPNFRVETDCGVRFAVEFLFDLEAFYLAWMDAWADELWLHEGVQSPDEATMTWCVVRDPDSSGFAIRLPTARPVGVYDPSTKYRSNIRWQGESYESHNVVYTWLPEGRDRPTDTFVLATQQLLYSTTVLAQDAGRRSDNGLTPRDEVVLGACTWAELGLGYWMQRQFEGPRGQALWQPKKRELNGRSVLESSVASLALEGVSSDSPLHRGFVRRELTNLIGLPFSEFHDDDRDTALHHAKARAFAVFLIESGLRPEKAERDTRTALAHYLRAAYNDGAKGHSSKEFDRGFGGRCRKALEALMVDWRDFCRQHVR